MCSEKMWGSLRAVRLALLHAAWPPEQLPATGSHHAEPPPSRPHTALPAAGPQTPYHTICFCCSAPHGWQSNFPTHELI